MASKILIVDPLTLLGREFSRCLENAPELGIEIDYRHTAEDDEVQISELGAKPALVSPLDDPDEVADAPIVVITTDHETERTRHLEDLLIRHPEITLLDVGRLPCLAELTRPATGATVVGADRAPLRVAHPALAATELVLTALKNLRPRTRISRRG